MNRSVTILCACITTLALALAARAATPAPAEESVDSTGLFSRVSPSVVLLTAYDASGIPLRQGSAFVVEGAGTLATANDVVADAAIVEVKAADGRMHAATALLASASDADLALLHVEGGPYPPLSLAEGDAPGTGMAVHVIGNAVQLRNALFSGVVTGRRTGSGGAVMLEISNQLYPVTSGAPLLGNDGRVLGVAIYDAQRAQDGNIATPVAALRALLAGAHGATPLRALGALSGEMRSRLDSASALRAKILAECTPSDVVNTDRVIRETLLVGTPFDDAGNSLGAFRLYEGAAYKLLYLLGDRCPSASGALGDAVAESARDDTIRQKAAVVRYAFDAILGVPADAPQAAQH